MTRLDRQSALAAVLHHLGFSEGAAPVVPRWPGMAEPSASWVLDMYQGLGGILTSPILRPRGWDIPTVGGLIFELDEEQHFNRYRHSTLQTSWASALPWVDDYKKYCVDHERAALKSHSGGGFWASDGSIAQFGDAGPRGDLDGSGSPRWKQRALYDAMRDAAAVAATARLTRLSVHDVVGNVRLGDALTGRGRLDTDALLDLIARRTSGQAGIIASPNATRAQVEPRLKAKALPDGLGSGSGSGELDDATVTIAEVARTLNRSPKTIRAALRSQYGTLAQRHNWVIDEEKETFLRSRFAQR